MRSYIVKENHIGSAVSEIFRYKQTETQILLLLYNKTILDQRGSRELAESGKGQEVSLWCEPHSKEVQHEAEWVAGRAAGAGLTAAGHTGKPTQLANGSRYSFWLYPNPFVESRKKNNI